MRTDRSGISFSVTLNQIRRFLLRKRLLRVSVVIGWCILFSVSISKVSAQARLVLNGANVNLAQGACLVIDNPAADAITRNSGHIISEGENNRIKWGIGTTAGTYIIPWGYGATDYIPLTFTKTAGTGSGHFLFSTYHTAWNNISQLPAGVTNIDGASGTDNSAFVSDRFWQISAQSYSTKPDLTNLAFTYLDAENAALNTITENNLRVKRYNSSLNSWSDNMLSSTLNTTANTLTVTSVDEANLHTWWILGTLNTSRYWVAPLNSNSNISANWSETAGGTGNAGVPIIGDAITFDGSSDFDCVLNTDLFGTSLTVSPGFSGTITQGSNAITISNDATFSGGTFTGGTSNISVNGNLTISGTTFTAPTAALDLKGDLNITSGSFINNNGTVLFSGTSGLTQNISSTSVTTFNNVLVTNAAASPGVSVQNNQNLKGTLTLASNVNFDADGSSNNAVFKLLSTGDNPTQDAAIATLPSGAQVSGNVTVQRFMTIEGANGGRIYRYISSPIQNATVADLQQEIPVSGSFTNSSVCSSCSTNGQSLFAYDETVITDASGNGTTDQHDGYIDFPAVTNSETFQPGKGYALYVRGNILSSALWDLRGLINRGNVTPVSFPITYTSSGTLVNDGWNLVGNPFPSTIDWNAASGWTKTNLDATIYITDNGNVSQYATWNGATGTNGGTRNVAIGQGFWVKGNGVGAPVLQANENIKTAGTQTVFFRDGNPDDLLRITMANATTRDETVIHFREDATEDFDTHADALKLPNGTFNLASLQTDGRKLAINSISPMDCQSGINLSVENSVAGNYRLDFSEHESFSDVTVITLEDNFTGTNFDIRSGGSYNFSVTSSPESYGSGRFKITFAVPPLDPDLMVSTGNVCEGSDALIQIDNAQDGVTYVASSDQGAFSLPVIGNGGRINLAVPGESLGTGQNNITVRATRESCSSQIEKSISLSVEKKYELLSVEGGKSCREGVIILRASGAPADGRYNWYESESAELPLADQRDSVFTTPHLLKSKTYFVSITNSLRCEGSRNAVPAEIVHFDDARITESGDLLQSNYAEGNQWYFNQKIIPEATQQYIKPDKSGIYMLIVTVNDCQTTAKYEVTIKEAKPVIPGTEIPRGTEITVFPNPVVDDVYVNVPRKLAEIREIRIINGAGQILGKLELQELNDNVAGTFKMSNYPSGVYIIQIISSGGIEKTKLVKH